MVYVEVFVFNFLTVVPAQYNRSVKTSDVRKLEQKCSKGVSMTTSGWLDGEIRIYKYVCSFK